LKFPQMFDDLVERLRLGILPFFWDPELNMLDVLTRDQVLEMYKCVLKIPSALREAEVRQEHYSGLYVLRVFSKRL